jgi:hypothetical protein
MSFRHLSLSAGLVVLALSAFTGIGAGAEADPHATAVKACTTASEHQRASLVTAIDDDRRREPRLVDRRRSQSLVL